jgi:hypothetical protein
MRIWDRAHEAAAGGREERPELCPELKSHLIVVVFGICGIQDPL